MKTKVLVEGKDAEVEILDDMITAAGWVKKDAIEGELTRRVDGIVKSRGLVKPDELKAQLLEDDAFIKQALDKKGIKPGPDTGEQAEAISRAVEEKRRAWEAAELTPLKQQVTDYEAQQDLLLEKHLHSQIVTAAAQAGVKKALLKPPTKGGTPGVVSMLESLFGFDTDTKEFYALEGESFAFSDTPSADHPLMTVEERVAKWAADPEHKDFVENPAQRGPGMQGAGGSRFPGTAGIPVHISKADSRDVRKLAAVQAEAVKRGLSKYDGVVIDD